MFRVIDPATYRTVAPLRFLEDNDRTDELWQDLAQGNALFVSGLVQQAHHLKRGDMLRLRTPRGEVDMRVAGIVQDITQGGYTVIGTQELAATAFGRNARGARGSCSA